MRRRLATAAAALLASAWMPAGATAAQETLTVTSPADPGDGNCATDGCTLREAVAQLNDGDTDPDRIEIVFANPFDHEIQLATGIPPIDEPLTIASTGRFGAVIKADPANRVFTVDAPAGTDVTFAGLTMRDGMNSGIVGVGGDLTIERSIVTANASALDGGGIRTYPSSTLTLRESTVADNEAPGLGGGIYATGGLTVERSTISGNRTTGLGQGAGVLALGTATIESSTISGNRSLQDGATAGGIGASGGPLAIRNSTIYDNHLAGATSTGGGLFTSTVTPEPVLTNTIVAGNSAGTSPDLGTDNDVFQVAFSLIGAVAGAPLAHTAPGSNLIDIDPELGGLLANGGPAATHLPRAGSPVIDKGASEATTDQRGEPRPRGNGADIGAVELPAVPPAPPARPLVRALRFGARTLVTLKLARKRIGPRSALRVVVVNRNSFAVTGRLSARRVKARSFRARARARRTIALRLPRALRRQLVRKGVLRLRVTGRVRDPAGTTRRVGARLRVRSLATRRAR